MQRSLELTVPGYPQNSNLRDTHHGWLDLMRHGVAGRLDCSYRLSQSHRSARAVENRHWKTAQYHFASGQSGRRYKV